MKQALLAVVLIALAGCGGGSEPEGPPRDAKLDQANSAGRQALAMGLPTEAIRQYKTALARAYERDDAAAIGDVAYNLALAELRAGDIKAATATIRDTRAELARRRAPMPAELMLVQAAAAYRSGDSLGADNAAREVLEATPQDSDTRARAWFIRGIVSADRSDSAGLQQAIAALVVTKSPDLEADRQELTGRAALLDNRAADALASFEQAAANRQQALDYRGMTRALSLAGDAALRSDRAPMAATLYLRAGRSILLQGDAPAALALLKRAEEVARATGQPDVVEEIGRVRRMANAR